MPRLPTMRVIGSHAISTSWDSFSGEVVIAQLHGARYPVSSARPLCRHLGSLSTVRSVIERSRRTTVPYALLAVEDTRAPGGSSMNGMNLSGKPGMVQAMQMPPTFGQPPMPFIHPRLGTLHFTPGPQQPILPRHFGEPYSFANWPCS